MELLSEPVTPEVSGMEKNGWSNSPAAPHAPDDVYPDMADPEPLKPGFSNAKAVRGDEDADVEAKVVKSSTTEDKSVQKRAAAKKAAPSKSTAKKG